MAINLNPSQKEVMSFYSENEIRTLLLDGSVGSGKTFVLILLFLMNASRCKNKKFKFIIGGASKATIQRNFLDDMAILLNREIVIDKKGKFELFGNTVYVFEGIKANSYKLLRGMNSAGSMLGEVTTLHKTFVKEVENRTRVNQAFILMDTNPDCTLHWVNQEYVLQSGRMLSSGKIDIYRYNMNMESNRDNLPADYIESLKRTYKVGSAMYMRYIEGKWTDETEASIYGDYMQEVTWFDRTAVNNLYVGLDLGIADGTSLMFGTVVEVDGKPKLRIIKNIIEGGKPTSYFIEKIKEYCINIRFKPENVNIILPHDSVNRHDGIDTLKSRFNEYSKHFPKTIKIPPIRQVDMISNTRGHLMDFLSGKGNIEFLSNMQDTVSKIKAYSWKISNGVIDTTQADHGKSWDSPSNICDSLEYLVYYTLGFDKVKPYEKKYTELAGSIKYKR